MESSGGIIIQQKKFLSNNYFSYKAELFGPYFIFLSAECQPPERLVPRALLPQKRGLQNTAKKLVRQIKLELC